MMQTSNAADKNNGFCGMLFALTDSITTLHFNIKCVHCCSLMSTLRAFFIHWQFFVDNQLVMCDLELGSFGSVHLLIKIGDS